MRKRSDSLIVLIGAFKLVKAALLIALAAGALSPLRRDFVHALGQWVQPHHHLVHRAIDRLDQVDERHLVELGIASAVYAALFIVEGLGLVARRVWAEYMTVAITTSFIPLEIYELVVHRSAMKAVVIAVNIAIVAYLVLRLRADRHWPFVARAWLRAT